MADQNFRVKRGLEVGIGGTVLIAKSDGNIGIGSAIPTTKLDVDGTVTATSFAGDGSNLTGVSAVNTELSGDTTPQLGGDLDLNSNDITGTGNVNITGVITATSFDGNLATTDLTGTITNAQLAGSIANDKLSNSSVSFGGVSVSLGAADATPAFDLQDATGYPTSSLEGTITNDQLAGSIADGKLASTFLKNVVEDTTPQLGGTLDTNGNLIQFGDSDSATNDRLQFGASQDLQIYHKTDSYIRDTGAGSLILTGSRIILKNPANDERMIDASENGSVKLLHNNLEKLETTGIGVSIVNGTETTATIAGPANLVLDPAAVGDNTGTVRIKGDLFVDGTQTQINSTTLELADFVVGVATTATTDLLTDGAGIGIGSDKTFLYEHNSGTNPSLKSSENLNVASGKGYQIDQTEVLNATTLGSNVVSSSLTSVGTLSALTVGGDVSIADKIVHTGDTNTAIRFPAADTITAETGGTESLRITSAGKVGIGETAPDAKLHVADEESTPSTIPGIYYSRLNNLAGDHANTDNADIRVVSHSSNYKMSIEDQNNTYLMVLKGDGKLGINESDPDYRLHITETTTSNNYAYIENTTAGNAGVRLKNNSADFLLLASSSSLRFYNNGTSTEAARIDSSGRLLVGTSSSFDTGSKVQIAGDDTTRNLALKYTGTSGNSEQGIQWFDFRNQSNASIVNSLQNDLTNQQAAHLIFKTSTAGTLAERMRIDRDGRLLVGTTSYSANATIVAQGHSGSSSGPAHLLLKSGSTSPADGADLGYLFFSDGNTSGGFGAWILGQRDGGTWTSGSSMPGRIVFSTTADGASSPTERLRITSDGEIGVNNTSPLSDLHVCTAGSSEQDGTFRIGGDGSGVGLVLDYDQSGSTLSRIMANDSYTNSSALLKISVDGDLNTNQLVLKGDGKVGIGTDNPLQKLHIVDDTSANIYLETKNSSIGSTAGIYFRTSDSSTVDAFFKTAIVLEDDDSTFGRGKLHILQENTADSSNATLNDSVVTVDQSGNIGIGTTNPGDWDSGANKLVISSTGNTGLTINTPHSTNRTGTIAFATDDSSSGGNEKNGAIVYVHGEQFHQSGKMHFSAGRKTSPYPFTILGAGRVGIMTNDPSNQFVISSGSGKNIEFNPGSTNRILNLDRGNSNAYLPLSVSANYLILNTGTNTTSEVLRITSAGNVGIGTDNPDAKLEINVGSATTALDIRGSEGQLFSVTNSLSSGSIFSVNDISGIPSIDVNADGTVQLAPFGGTVELYYNGTKRFETTGVGVTITGLIGLGGANYGTSGQVLTSNGGSSAPSWQDAGGGGGGEFSLSGTGKAIHSSAAGNSSSASHSFFVGTDAGNNTTTGSNNNFIGCKAGCSNTEGYNNNFMGVYAGFSNTTGFHNNFFGCDAGRHHSNGSHNNYFGHRAGYCSSCPGNNNFFGECAGMYNTYGSSNNFFGSEAGKNNTTGYYNNFIGSQAGKSNTTGCYNNFFGANVANGAYGSTCQTGNHNNYFGFASGQVNTTGSYNNFFGCRAGNSTTSGNNNNFFGRGAGLDNTTGCHNNFFGWEAGKYNTTGEFNNFIGCRAGLKNTCGYRNLFIGSMAGCNNTTAPNNVYLGDSAGRCGTTNYGSTMVGRWSGLETTGSRNTFLGSNSGEKITSGSDNIAIGSYAGQVSGGGYYSFLTGNYNIIIGNWACVSSLSVSNEVSISNQCKIARFQGNATAWSFVSDEREKKNIIDLPLGGDFLSKLRPRKFEWKSEDEDSHEQASGFVAQEVLKVVEEYNAHYTGLVDTNDPNQYTFAAAALIPMIVNAIQELRQELEQVKSRIDTLESS